MIQEESQFKILMIHDYRAKNISRFVKEIYSYDYAPFKHLKKKTRYLLRTSRNVTFIFFENNNPQEYYDGDGAFRHLESKTLKQFKNVIRDAFNERKKDRRTEKHVIHASDNQQQTDYILKYLGFPDGVNMFLNEGLIKVPCHIRDINEFTLESVEIDKLLYNQIVKKGFKRKRTALKKISDMPHYKALNGEFGEYEKYYQTFRGRYLKDPHSKESLIQLSKEFEYLKKPHETAYILVKKSGDDYIILDGSHRVAILKHRGEKEIIVAIV